MTGRILLISGSRSFATFPQHPFFHLFHLIFKIFNFNPFEGDKVLVGGAKGIDMMVLNYLMTLGRHNNKAYMFAYDVMDAEWDKYGRAAGPIRNSKMVKICTQGATIWDGKSRGTKDTLDKLEKADKLLIKITL